MLLTALQLPAAVRAAIAAMARAAAPRELVGLLGGPACGARRIEQFVPLPPECGGPHGFHVAAHEFAVAEAVLRGRGARWLGFVHSHPVGTAQLSHRDRRELWRECLQLVVGAASSAAPTFAAWWLPNGDGPPHALTLETA